MRTLKFIAVLLLLATTAQGQDLKFLLLKGDIATMRRYDSAAVKAAINAKLSTSDTASMLRAYQTSINSKQETLVNGTNLKTVNGNSLLGSGNVTISTSITSGDVTGALGYTPYNASNPDGFINSVPAQSFASLTGKPTTLSGYGITDAYPLTGNPSAFLTSSALSPYLTSATAASTYQPIGSYLTASSITGKVNYTDTSSMLSAYGSLINNRVKYTDTSGMLSAYSTAINTKQNSLGFTPYNATNPSGYISSYTETDPIVKAINGLVKSNGTTISTATAGTDYLTPTGSAASLTSFPTFNQNTTGTAAGLTTGRTISISGDLAYTSPSFNGTSNVSAAGTLATVNSNVGSFGSATQVPSYTVNAKGLITAASNTTIQIPESQVTNLTTDLAAKQGTLTLTTTGTSGAATLVGNTLNIPSYSGGGAAAWGGITGTLSSQTDLQSALNAKQNTIVSGTDIKTINGNSIVGSGNLALQLPVYKFLSSTYTAVGTGSANFNDYLVSDTLVAGGVYEVEINLLNSPSLATSAIQQRFTYTGTYSLQQGDYQAKLVSTTTTAPTNGVVNAGAAISYTLAAAAVVCSYKYKGNIFCTTNGVLKAQATIITASSTYTINQGATMKITKLN